MNKRPLHLTDSWENISKLNTEMTEKLSKELPQFIGQGTTQSAWRLRGGRVLKLFSQGYLEARYENSYRAWKNNNIWRKHEPKVFDFGILDDRNNIKYVITEYFNIIQQPGIKEEVELFIDECVFQMSTWDYDFSQSPLNNSKYRKIQSITEQLDQKIRLTDFAPLVEFFGYEWVKSFMAEIVYKLLISADFDLIEPNFGLREETREPVFFDW